VSSDRCVSTVAGYARRVPALLCVQCGGPLPPEAATTHMACAFCGATSVPPPRVVEREVERIVERVVVRDSTGAPAALACLRCGTSMRETNLDGMTVSQCASCGGAWVPSQTTSLLRRRSSEDMRRAVAVGEMMALARPPRAPLHCPDCKTPMETVGMAETVHAVDVCHAHGTWFDRTELAAFMDREK
jgi:Zn-finger nucleic acid-binding protein